MLDTASSDTKVGRAAKTLAAGAGAVVLAVVLELAAETEQKESVKMKQYRLATAVRSSTTVTCVE